MNARLIALVASAAVLTGCGMSPSRPLFPQGVASAGAQALATKTLLDGFKHIHRAAFTKLDVNSDGRLDEYEAGSAMDLKDFGRADKNRDGKLTKTEFMNFATGGSVFGFLRQDRVSFMKATRDVLWRGFQRLDANKDRQLKAAELSDKALAKVGINLRIDGLRIRVALTDLDDAIFESSDKTGDGALTQAEFEDYCMHAFVKGINPSYQFGPAPAPNPAPPAEPAQPAEPGGEEPSGDGEDW
jgi:Ca2+-binding EF-hand superfamily protein